MPLITHCWLLDFADHVINKQEINVFRVCKVVTSVFVTVTKSNKPGKHCKPVFNAQRANKKSQPLDATNSLPIAFSGDITTRELMARFFKWLHGR
jgi:hypothetical protein